MNKKLQEMAKKKWFVPIIIIILFLISISSWSGTSESKESSLSMEEKIKEICMAISGAENATVMITYEKYDTETFWSGSSDSSKISGIAVICDGGDDPNIQLKILNALKALFGISSTRITITQRN